MKVKRFGRLTVLEPDTHRLGKGVNAFWVCKCSCGEVVSVRMMDLKSGNTKSCGCLKRESSKMRMTTHGESKTKLYGVWNTMMTRCYNPKSDRYSRYGGRGIKVCEEWLHNYPAFRDWALSHGYEEGLSIDRIDLDYDYCPENCRWVTIAEQMKNTSTNRYLTFDGETLILAEWSRRVGITAETISKRLARGWTVEKALTTRPRKERLNVRITV